MLSLSILQYFWPALSDNLSWKPIFDLFESDRLDRFYYISQTACWKQPPKINDDAKLERLYQLKIILCDVIVCKKRCQAL